MKKNKYGLSSWDEVNFGGRNNNQPRKDLFLRLNEGSNNIRIVTKPYQYFVHRWKDSPNDPGFGYKVKCSAFYGECPICDIVDSSSDDKTKLMKAKQRWYVGVIDRVTQTFKILDISFAIYNAIKEYNNDDDWGNPELYDINIKVNSKGGATGYYSVIPRPKSPLSSADLEIKKEVENVHLDEIVARCKPPTPEEVAKRMEAIRKYKNSNSNANAPTANQAAEVEREELASSGDEDFTFPTQAN